MEKSSSNGVSSNDGNGVWLAAQEDLPHQPAAGGHRVTTAAAAASSEESKKEEAKGDGKGYVVALCNYSIGNSWHAQMGRNLYLKQKIKIRRHCSEYYITNSNEEDINRRCDMQDLITKKVDAIVITAASQLLLHLLEEASSRLVLRLYLLIT